MCLCNNVSLISVLGNLYERIGELYISGKASLTCWRAKYGETASLTILANLYILYMLLLFFRFQASPKKLFVSCDYCLLFVCLFLMVSNASSWNAECLISKYPKKYVRKINISLLRTAVLMTIFFMTAMTAPAWNIICFSDCVVFNESLNRLMNRSFEWLNSLKESWVCTF